MLTGVHRWVASFATLIPVICLLYALCAKNGHNEREANFSPPVWSRTEKEEGALYRQKYVFSHIKPVRVLRQCKVGVQMFGNSDNFIIILSGSFKDEEITNVFVVEKFEVRRQISAGLWYSHVCATVHGITEVLKWWNYFHKISGHYMFVLFSLHLQVIQ
jgi:hypothetical protein